MIFSWKKERIVEDTVDKLVSEGAFAINKPEDAELAYRKGIEYKAEKVNELTKFVINSYTDKLLQGEASFSYCSSQRYGNNKPSIPYSLMDKVIENIRDILGEDFEVSKYCNQSNLRDFIEINRKTPSGSQEECNQ